MATIYYDNSADLSLIRAKKVAVFGYGSQGHAHALNLKDSGVDVRVVLQAGSRSRAKAEADGLTVVSGSEASAWADVIMLLTPDTTQAGVYAEQVAPHLSAGKMLMFAHGFNIRFKTICAAGRRRRDADRAEGAGPPRARGVRGGRRDARAAGRGAGCDR